MSSLKKLRKRAEQNPLDPAAWQALGMLALEEGNPDEALAALIKALACGPSVDQAISIGMTFDQLGRTAEAIQAYERAARADAESPDAHGLLGVALANTGQLSRALIELKRAAQLARGAAEPRYVLAGWLLQAGRQTEAIAELRIATALDPLHYPAHLLLGRSLRLAGDPAAAREALLRLRELDPHDTQATIELGIVSALCGDRSVAQQLFDEALVAANGAPGMLVNIALAHREIGDLASALRHLRQAVHRDPNLVEGHTNLGILLMEEGSLGAATVALERAVELGREWPIAHFNLGVACERYGNLERAEEAFVRTMELQPADDEAAARLQAVRQAMRDRARDRRGAATDELGRSTGMVGLLEEFPLPDLLQLLKASRRTGTLHLSGGTRTGDVRLADGAIIAASSPAANLGVLLCRQHGVTDEQIERTLARQRQGTDRPMGELLVEDGVLSRTQLEQSLFTQVKHAVREMLGWNVGRFAFEPSRRGRAAETSNGLLRLDVENILLEVFREQDEEHRDGEPEAYEPLEGEVTHEQS